MNVKDLEYFKNIILEKRREVLKSKGKLESDGVDTSEKNTGSDDLKYTTHIADLGSDTMGKEFNSYLNARTGKYLKYLDEALLRIAKGDYGVCFICGNEIPKERLQVIPHTRYCVTCKSQKE